MQENQCDHQHSLEVEETTAEAENGEESSSLIGQ